MLGLGIRRGLRRTAVSVLDAVETVLTDNPVRESVYTPPTAPPAPVAAAPVVAAPTPVEVAPEPITEPEAPAEAAPPAAAEAPFTRDELEAVLDEMVRPALNMDGGDMTLVKLDGQDIHVMLVGACSTCPSATITMKMGIQRLLEEEFPTWTGDLIQVQEMI